MRYISKIAVDDGLQFYFNICSHKPCFTSVKQYGINANVDNSKFCTFACLKTSLRFAIYMRIATSVLASSFSETLISRCMKFNSFQWCPLLPGKVFKCLFSGPLLLTICGSPQLYVHILVGVRK